MERRKEERKEEVRDEGRQRGKLLCVGRFSPQRVHVA